MNEIPIIRKGSFKDYWSNGFTGGFVIGLFGFFFSLVNNKLLTALIDGLISWLLILVLFIGVGFFSEEYFKRKQRIKKLNSGKYSFLDENKFSLNENLYFEGEYLGYWFRVLPTTKWLKRGKSIEFDVIEAYYTFETTMGDEEKENSMAGYPFPGILHFANHCVRFVPNDWQSPHFKENFDGLINVLDREKLKPLSKKDWEETFGMKLKEEKLNEEKSRTKQIIKIGKLDIKYIKPIKNSNR